jgi:hypothetical protein
VERGQGGLGAVNEAFEISGRNRFRNGVNMEWTEYITLVRKWDPSMVAKILGIPRNGATGNPLEEALDSYLVIQARREMLRVHNGRKRDNGEPYIAHTARVRSNALAIIANRQTSGFSHMEEYRDLCLAHNLALAIASADCHDNVEDGEDERQERDTLLCLDPRLDMVVDLLSKRKGESYYDFIHRLVEEHSLSFRGERVPFLLRLIARIIKAADLQDNLYDSPEGSRKDKYRFALDLVDPTKEMRRWEEK